MTLKSFLPWVLLLACPGAAWSATITNLVLTYNHSGPSSTTYTTSLTISSNYVVRVLHLNITPNTATNPRLVVDVGGATVASYSSGDFSTFGGAPVVVGPATLRLTATANANTTVSGTLYCCAEISSLEDKFVPSNSVVIPADIGGPVNIILESSEDLVNWTSALPGEYGTNTVKRFFRVRAERTQ